MGIRNKRVLIVEDEPLVAMDLAGTLEDEGCEVVGPAATLQKARDLIEASKFDAALLDANLGGQSSGPLAAALTQFNVPFAFVSGYGRESLPEAFRQAPLIEKPYARSRLVEVVTQLVERSAAAIPLRRFPSD